MPFRQGIFDDLGQRPCSRKSRIKTFVVFAKTVTKSVRDHVPEKVGLRLFIFLFPLLPFLVRDHVPEKVGLRHSSIKFKLNLR